MADLFSFMERWHGQKADVDARPEDIVTPEGEQRAHRSMLPLLLRTAERADVDLDVLRDVQADAVSTLPRLVIGRVVAGELDLATEVGRALADVAVDAFLAGALWEQERQLPDLEDDDTP